MICLILPRWSTKITETLEHFPFGQKGTDDEYDQNILLLSEICHNDLPTVHLLIQALYFSEKGKKEFQNDISVSLNSFNRRDLVILFV